MRVVAVLMAVGLLAACQLSSHQKIVDFPSALVGE
jgi:hypothetical protein